MRTSIKLFFLITMCAMVGVTACKKGKDTETPVDQRPHRPASPSGTLSLHGAYSQSGAIGTFRDCTTGEQWVVAHEGDNVALEDAYMDSGVTLGSPLIVTVEGGIDYRERPDGAGREVVLIIARFVQVGPGAVCP